MQEMVKSQLSNGTWTTKRMQKTQIPRTEKMSMDWFALLGINDSFGDIQVGDLFSFKAKQNKTKQNKTKQKHHNLIYRFQMPPDELQESSQLETDVTIQSHTEQKVDQPNLMDVLFLVTVK